MTLSGESFTLIILLIIFEIKLFLSKEKTFVVFQEKNSHGSSVPL